jgi:hypothetical protein
MFKNMFNYCCLLSGLLVAVGCNVGYYDILKDISASNIRDIPVVTIALAVTTLVLIVSATNNESSNNTEDSGEE